MVHNMAALQHRILASAGSVLLDTVPVYKEVTRAVVCESNATAAPFDFLWQ